MHNNQNTQIPKQQNMLTATIFRQMSREHNGLCKGLTDLAASTSASIPASNVPPLDFYIAFHIIHVFVGAVTLTTIYKKYWLNLSFEVLLFTILYYGVHSK
uniref:Uncharacterized protein n=1 Tax=Glossina pallidipes TaxID=7398 RepID=A0A1B0A9B3_GLOPL